MTTLLLIMVAVAGGVGAVLRFLIDTAAQRRLGPGFAWGTMIINVTGSLLLGMITALASRSVVTPEVGVVIGTGLLGGYTTFSAAAVETVRLIRDRRWVAATINGPGMLALSIGVAVLGGAVAWLLTGG